MEVGGGAGGYFGVLPILELQQLGRTWLQSAMGPESSPRFGAGRRPSSDPDLTLATRLRELAAFQLVANTQIHIQIYKYTNTQIHK